MAEIIPIREETVALVYASRQENPTIDESMLKSYSKEYFRSRDEFEREELKQKLVPTLKSEISTYKMLERTQIKIGTRLKEYDFEKNIFPTALSSSSIVEFSDYIIVIDNIEKFINIPIPTAEAKKISSAKRSNQGRIVLEIVGTLISTEEKLIKGKEAAYRPRTYEGTLKKVLTISATEVAVRFRNGTQIAKLKI